MDEVSDDEDNMKEEGGDAPIVHYSKIADYPKEKIVYKYFRSLLKQCEYATLMIIIGIRFAI